MKRQFILFSFTSILLFSLSASVLAQGGKKKALSEKDKQAIIDIFRALKNPFYLEFSRTEYYGKKDLMPLSLTNEVTNNKSSGQTAGYLFRTHIEIGMWYTVATGSGVPLTLEDVFGKTNASRLESIMKKYGIVAT